MNEFDLINYKICEDPHHNEIGPCSCHGANIVRKDYNWKDFW